MYDKPVFLNTMSQGFPIFCYPMHAAQTFSLSSEGLDNSCMEVPPLLNTQHYIGVDAGMSFEGQASICMDISPSPQAQHSYELDKLPLPQSQHSYGIDSAPLPEGIDFGMDLLPPLGAPGYEITDAPQHVEPEDHSNKPLRAEEDAMKDIPQPNPRIFMVSHWQFTCSQRVLYLNLCWYRLGVGKRPSVIH